MTDLQLDTSFDDFSTMTSVPELPEDLETYYDETPVWPQQVIRRPRFNPKFYAPPLSMPKPLPADLVSEYENGKNSIKNAEEKLDKAIAAYNKIVGIKLSPWGAKATRDAHEKNIAVAIREKQAATDTLNSLIERHSRVEKIVELQEEILTCYKNSKKD
jgi:hypothetical protein